jgi:hypothetical protein
VKSVNVQMLWDVMTEKVEDLARNGPGALVGPVRQDRRHAHDVRGHDRDVATVSY